MTRAIHGPLVCFVGRPAHGLGARFAIRQRRLDVGQLDPVLGVGQGALTLVAAQAGQLQVPGVAGSALVDGDDVVHAGALGDVPVAIDAAPALAFAQLLPHRRFHLAANALLGGRLVLQSRLPLIG